jgi:DNA adenine methylase
MRYFGGKTRIGKELAKFVNKTYGEPTVYWEPFCGMFSVGENITAKKRVATDKNEDVILLWKALQEGWHPPTEISEEQYLILKNEETPSALRGFVGFGCSHSGKFFCGYARDSTDRNYALNAHRSLLRKIKKVQDVSFSHGDYFNFYPAIHNSIIYCDPPYKGTAGSPGFDSSLFDFDRFWQWVRKKSEKNIILVSEYVAPEDFSPVWQKSVTLDMYQHDRVEKLFKYQG